MALGSQAVSAPVVASTAARLLRTSSFTRSKVPPKYTRVLSSDSVIAETTAPLPVPGLKPGSTEPSPWTAASLLRACPPMVLKSPPTQKVAPSFDTASCLTPPPPVAAVHSTPPFPSTADRPSLWATEIRPSGMVASAETVPTAGTQGDTPPPATKAPMPGRGWPEIVVKSPEK